jgi:hypothetical protein
MGRVESTQNGKYIYTVIVRTIGARRTLACLHLDLTAMGNHYNPLSISIVNSESIDSITTSWRNTAKALYSLFKEVFDLQ